jgi:peptidoglycan/xylan/chitin deacetylase (PgdA/CDA1 family)
MKPIISIVMPAYNAANHLSEAIESVHQQTFDAWELVVVDDGSTDETASIVNEWSARDPRVRLLQQVNQGASAARDAGLRDAVGTWVAFLDADDWIDTDFMKKMYRPLRRSGLDGTFCAAADVVENGEWGKVWRPVPREDFFPTMAVDCPIAVHCGLLRRQLVLDVGGWDHKLQTSEDWDLWQRLARTKARFKNLDAVLAFIRLRQGSLSRSYPARMARDGRIVLTRGRERDPRVPDPDPKWADGLKTTDGDIRIALHLVWAAGLDIVEGGDGLEIINGFEGHQFTGLEPYDVALVLQDAISHTVGAVDLNWNPFLPKISKLAAHLEEIGDTPALEKRVLRALEGIAFQYANLKEPVVLGSTYWIALDVAEPIQDVIVTDGVQQLAAVVHLDGERIGMVQLAIQDGGVDRHRLANAIAERLGAAIVVRRLRRPTNGGMGTLVATVKKAFTRKSIWFALSLLQYRQKTHLARLHRFAQVTGADLALDGGILRLASGQAPGATANPSATSNGKTRSYRDPRERSAGDPDQADYGENYWESVFSSKNPWEYDNLYEQTKYEQTLDLLGNRKISTALELACAEGFFTQLLASRVDTLVATDISETAVQRAQEACSEFDNISFRQLDLIEDQIHGKFDLIVCSEVLYYFESRRTLSKLAAKLSEHLNPGGVILMAHGLIAANNPEETGFDWGHAFDARSIGKIFAESPGLKLVEERRTDLYRIHLLEAADEGETKPQAANIVEINRAEDLSYYVSSQIEWNGCARFKTTEVTDHLPILLYHRVTDEPTHQQLEPYRLPLDTFEANLKYLANNGFYSVTLEDWEKSRSEYSGLKGRPVVITFDDGYVDFHDHAWPLLQKYGFSATVFVVSDLVGRASEWDTRFGAPTPLMDWNCLRKLSSQGVSFGSHTATHPFLTMMTPQELAREARTSKDEIEQQLGVPVTSVAYPYGEHSEVIERVFEDQGYSMGLTVSGTLSDVYDHHMRLGRVEFPQNQSIEKFGNVISKTQGMNVVGRSRYTVANGLRYLRYNVL